MKALKSLIFCLIVFLGVNSLAVAAPLSQPPIGQVLYVKEHAQGDADCSEWANACSLQHAMEKAIPLPKPINIWVASGTYIPSTSFDRFATFQLKSGVRIYGGFPATGTGWGWTDRNWQTNLTTLSGDIGAFGDSTDNSYHVVTAVGVEAIATLDGFTITAGNADNEVDSFTNLGGGIFILKSNPTLTNLVIKDNSAYSGAGMANLPIDYESPDGSNPTLTNVTFSHNTADAYGGGMYNSTSSPTLTNVNFFDNNVIDGFGGGMYNENNSTPTLTDVTFSGNWTTGDTPRGGGMYNSYSSPTLTNVTFTGNGTYHSGGAIFNLNSSPTLTNVTFSNNTAGAFGGGMYNSYSSPTLTNVTFSDNTAGKYGGGMYNEISSLTLTNVTFTGNSVTSTLEGNGGGMFNYLSSPVLTNVTFSGNSAIVFGGGMYNTSCIPPTTLTNVTFTDNSTSGVDSKGGAIYNFNCGLILTNAIVWGNSPDQIKNFGSSVVAATFSDIQGGGFPGDGNINADPHLGSLANYGGFVKTHALPFGSDAIDTGSSSVCQTTDARGFPRPIDGDDDGSEICDMGAYEFDYFRLYLPLTSK